MNSQEIVLSLNSPTTSADLLEYSRAIPYLLSDETFAAVEFGNNTTQNSLSSKYIALDFTPGSTFIINSLGPTTITFNPSGLNFPKKINRIVWSFDDGTPDISRSFYYASTSVNTAHLPYPDEPGDPRNFTITKTFATSEFFNKTFIVQAQIYQLGKPDFATLYYVINILSPEIDGLGSGFFEEMHLVSTKMFGPNNDILYVFETKNPKYIIPFLLNWKETPKAPLAQTNAVAIDKRPYKLLQPFELDNLNSNSDIKIVKLVPSSNPVVDRGGK
jgi:hypothetical protein